MKHRLVLIIISLFGRLPLSAGRRLGAAVGWLLGVTNSRAARVTRVNLALCQSELTDPERERLARQSLIETGKLGVEMAAIWHHDERWLKRRILEEDGSGIMSRKLAKGKGLIVLTPHLGNWEALSAFLTRWGALTVLYQPPKNAAVGAFMINGRLKPNVKLAPTNRLGVRQLFKALRSGEMVGILPDQVPDEGSGAELVPFFGEPALTMTLIHSLMERTGCEVVMAFCQRINGGFRMVVRECDAGIYSADSNPAVAALNRSVETVVRMAPAQYQWEYKRFRGRPQGEPY